MGCELGGGCGGCAAAAKGAGGSGCGDGDTAAAALRGVGDDNAGTPGAGGGGGAHLVVRRTAPCPLPKTCPPPVAAAARNCRGGQVFSKGHGVNREYIGLDFWRTLQHQSSFYVGKHRALFNDPWSSEIPRFESLGCPVETIWHPVGAPSRFKCWELGAPRVVQERSRLTDIEARLGI
jgi:hypothetical protein